MKGTSEAARLRLASVAAEYVESLGRGMRFQREQLGLSRSEVARKLPGKTNENAIYRWEGGQHKPNDAALEALAKILEVGHWTKFMDLDPLREKPADTPDLSTGAVRNGAQDASQLDRIESKLDQILALLTDDELAPHVRGILDPSKAPPAPLANPRQTARAPK